MTLLNPSRLFTLLRLTTLFPILSSSLWLCTSVQAADAAADLSAADKAAAEQVVAALTADFYEIEFFVFERNSVMEFNTREVLVHNQPVPYPATMIALNSPDEIVGSSYFIDANTRLCLTYPSITYTTSDPYAQLTETVTGADAAVPPVPEAIEPDSDQDTTTLPAIPSQAISDPEAELSEAIATFETELYERSERWMEPESFLLRREASQIERRAGARILFHGRWLQALPARDAPVAVMVLGGEPVGEGRELLGSVGVTLGRYLHFQAALNYVAPALGNLPAQVAVNNDGSLLLVPAPAPREGFMTLAQSRRMRSGELHYLDHPKLGIVVRIDPISVPQQLIDSVRQLKESQQ